MVHNASGFAPTSGAFATLVLVLSTIDAAATLVLLGAGCEELNPAMSLLLEYGVQAFLLGKFLITAAGMPVLLICRNQYLFGAGIRAGYFLPGLAGVYGLLIAYQITPLLAS